MAPRVLILGGRGYVGAALTPQLQTAGCHVDILDAAPDATGTPGRSYQNLTTAELKHWDNLLLLAGHTSVQACQQAPETAFANNVVAFRDLLTKLAGQRLLFASTVSVYGRTDARVMAEADALSPPLAAYDAHKQEIERLAAAHYPEHSYALRFGTVTGPSPALRGELLINSLVRTALTQGCVRVANRNKHRPVLGLPDLGRAVLYLLTHTVPPGSYNLASFNVRIGDAADYVARHFGVPCLDITQETPYDVRVSTTKWETVTGVSFQDTLESLVATLTTSFQPPRPGGTAS